MEPLPRPRTDPNLATGLGQSLMCPVRVKGASDAAPADRLIADPDTDFGGVDGDSRSSYGSQNAPPVWICARPCGLYQQGMGHGLGHLPGLRAIPCLLDGETNYVLHSFAVGHDLLGQGIGRPAGALQKTFSVRDGLLQTLPRSPTRQQQHGVIGGGVSVDRDAVERLLAGP